MVTDCFGGTSLGDFEAYFLRAILPFLTIVGLCVGPVTGYFILKRGRERDKGCRLLFRNGASVPKYKLFAG